MRIVLLCLLFSLIVAPASAQITNGGFESPSDEPPALGQWQYIGGALRETSSAHGGAYAARMANSAEAANVYVFQQTETGAISAGTQYALRYWAQGEYGVSGVGQVQLSFLNAQGNLLPGSPQFFNIPPSDGYAVYVHNVTAPVNASALYLGFNSVTGAVTGASSLLLVDDVSFTSTVGSAAADFNRDFLVDGLDLAEWRTAFGSTSAADADSDNDSDGADFLVWQRSIAPSAAPVAASVPEPCGFAISLSGIFLMGRPLRKSAGR